MDKNFLQKLICEKDDFFCEEEENEQFIDISAEDLKRDCLTDEDKKRIKNHSIRRRVNNYIGLIYCLPFLFLFLFVLKETLPLTITEINPLNIFCTVMILIALKIISQTILATNKSTSDINKSIKNDNFKAQYGKVYNKYYRKYYKEDRDTNRTRIVYEFFVDVVFPNDKTIIRKIRVGNLMYISLDEKTDVIVISYDGENSYCIKA